MTKFAKIFSPNKDKPAAEDPVTPLRIVRAGGIVESYYMALPAARVMERHPRSVLARPEVFRRPFESVVRPDEILTPGEKLYLVPRGTVRKLQVRLPLPSLCPSAAPPRPAGRKRVRFIDVSV